eukprot:COSAG01_NODE_2037_length_8579_cov_119.860849_12_plen_90_part_00
MFDVTQGRGTGLELGETARVVDALQLRVLVETAQPQLAPQPRASEPTSGHVRKLVQDPVSRILPSASTANQPISQSADQHRTPAPSLEN